MCVFQNNEGNEVEQNKSSLMLNVVICVCVCLWMMCVYLSAHANPLIPNFRMSLTLHAEEPSRAPHIYFAFAPYNKYQGHSCQIY